MKKMNKVIAAIMIMAITAAPAIAANKVDKNARPDRNEMRTYGHKYDRGMDKHFDRHAATIEVTTFKVNQRTAMRKNVVMAAKAVNGVKDVKWNPRTGMMTVAYDIRKTNARRIIAAVN